jgi:hypothetical protein
LTQEAETKLKQVLDETQQKRLQEVWIQIGGPAVLDDPQIVAALKITDQQKQQLEEIAQTSREKRRTLFQDAQDATREQRRAQMDQLREQTNEQRLAVLTDQQREQFEQMKGQPFEFDRSQLFRGGRGGGGGGRGGDNEA